MLAGVWAATFTLLGLAGKNGLKTMYLGIILKGVVAASRIVSLALNWFTLDKCIELQELHIAYKETHDHSWEFILKRRLIFTISMGGYLLGRHLPLLSHFSTSLAS